MQTTMHLLEKALAQHPAPYWTKKLNLARTTLATAKVREHLSPAIAGALAEELGEEADKWIVIAALESERDSACKSRMMRRFLGAAALAGAALAPVGAASAATIFDAANSPAVYYVKLHLYAACKDEPFCIDAYQCPPLSRFHKAQAHEK